MKSKIPIQNIYYLLIYAWDCLDENEIVNVKGLDPLSLIDLLGSVLSNGINHLLKRGLDRGYIETQEETSSPRGRIDINRSISRLLHRKGRLHCISNEINYDILHNQILKATARLIVRCGEISKSTNEALCSHLRRFKQVSDITVTSSHFRRVQLHSNNAFYSFLMRLCELVHDNLLLSEKDGPTKFRNFISDEDRMAKLFESFVRNFYCREQDIFAVKSEMLNWRFKALDEDSTLMLPKMRTDISLISSTRKIIIDTKFYSDILTHYYGKESLRSNHIYQIRTYLEHANSDNKALEGVLLYPTVSRSINIDYSDEQFNLKIRTINLAQDWRNIHGELLGIIT